MPLLWSPGDHAARVAIIMALLTELFAMSATKPSRPGDYAARAMSGIHESRAWGERSEDGKNEGVGSGDPANSAKPPE